MNIDSRDLREFTRRATDLMSETAEVPRLLQIRLGQNHPLTHAAIEMQARIEELVRELRYFDIPAQSSEADGYGASA